MPGGGAMNPGPAAPADAAAQERLLCRPVPAIAAEIESATGRSAMPYGVRGGCWVEVNGPVEAVHVGLGPPIGSCWWTCS